MTKILAGVSFFFLFSGDSSVLCALDRNGYTKSKTMQMKCNHSSKHCQLHWSNQTANITVIKVIDGHVSIQLGREFIKCMVEHSGPCSGHLPGIYCIFLVYPDTPLFPGFIILNQGHNCGFPL
eukprot:TRINITY_DN14992_c0_g2_i1.p1 TRINITY_DN14992_c0_g2~~TRINITY_DN14992_c0_g2_i1.p1  ORF type:complete len:123 (-),score=5.84 TRINITY_DN14992_c0_g2_i1:17-385(-)